MLALASCAAPMAPPAPPSGLATGPSAAGGQCFYASTVSGSTTDGPAAVNLRVRVNQVWRLELETACPGLELSSARIGLKERAGSTGRICSGADLDVVPLSSNIPAICAVRSVRQLSQAEIAGLADRARP